ncbi:MAG: DUF58 domain-containing protein [Armatimonadetes bacterium]|nr:DUF58 domain-containing protein [Armatimonadota bacterium]
MNRLGSAGIKSLVITVATAFLFVVAVLLDLQYLYLMAVALAVLPLASYTLAYFFATRFAASREHSATVPEGRRLSVTLEVVSQGGLPQSAVQVVDTIPAELINPDTPNALTTPAPLPTWDGATGSRTDFVEPQYRGVYKLGPARLVSTDPLGLFSFSANLPIETELVVLPEPLAALDKSAGGEGARGVRERDGKTRRGEGMEFHGVREYQQGDPLRRVHWPTSARTGKLAVIEFERAYQQDICIVMDLTAGTNYGRGRDSTLEYAVKVAATLADRTLRAGGGVRLLTQHDNLAVKPREADPEAARFRLFDRLARLKCDADTPLAPSLTAARTVTDGGTHYAVLTSYGEPGLLAFLADRVRHGDSVVVYFFEPTSFGGVPKGGVLSPAVAGKSATLRVIECGTHSPWKEGGRNLEYLLRDDS